MISQSFLAATTLAFLGIASAEPQVHNMWERSAQICYDGESTSLTCYNPPDGTPQDVNVSDVAYIAAYLRAYGAQTRAGRLFSMTAADTPDCDEYTLYQHGSALALAKHVNNQVNSSVLYADIANTIDGGAKATAAQQQAAIIGCGTSGGSEGVQYNSSNPAYHASTYPSGYTPDGILIKIVTSTPQ